MMTVTSGPGARIARALLRYKDWVTAAAGAQTPARDQAAALSPDLHAAPPGEPAQAAWRMTYRSVLAGADPPGRRRADGVIHVNAGYGRIAGVTPAGPGAVMALPGMPRPTASGLLTGQIDVMRRDLVEGWAHDDSTPLEPVALVVLVDGAEVKRVAADRHRGDLQAAGIGSGHHAFSVSMPWLTPANRHVIAVRRAADGRDLLGSPAVIEPSTSFDAALEQGLTSALAALDPGAEQDRVLSFLLAQTDKLLQRRARKRGGVTARRPLARSKSGPRPVKPMSAAPRQHALVIDNAMPGDDAGSHAILAHMRALQALNYQVRFVVAEGPSEPDPTAEAMEAEGIACCRAPYYVSVEELLQRLDDGIDIVYLHRLPDTTYYIPLVRAQLPKARILFSVADLTHVRLAREHGLEAAPDLLPHSPTIRWTEIDAAWSAAAPITHSTIEAAMLRQAVPGAVTRLWAGPDRVPQARFNQRAGVALAVGAAHPHVIDAAVFLVEDIMPLVWETHPGIECRLVCTAACPPVQRLARPGVVVTGPAVDPAGELSRARLTTAPYRFGDGVADGVLASLAAGLPCALTPLAAEGIDWPGALAGCLGITAAELAMVIVRLHDDAAANAAASAAGLALTAQRSDEASVQAALQAAIEGWHDLAAD